jgi:hypothetical protein
MELSKRIVYWKIEMDDIDITGIIHTCVNNITIKHTLLPAANAKQGEETPPITATISFVSKNYIEDYFITGQKIKIYMGYDRLALNNCIFSGIIPELPGGSAKDMLTYTVKLYGDSAVDLSLETKTRAFNVPDKIAIISEIMSVYNCENTIKIQDSNAVGNASSLIQRNITDLQMIQDFAKEWGCVYWFSGNGRNFYFMDAKEAHENYNFGYSTTYNLGYRTDFMNMKCNVQQISWKHKSPRAALEEEPGVHGRNEIGEVYGLKNFAIISPDSNGQWKTWSLRPEYQNIASTGTIEQREELSRVMFALSYRKTLIGKAYDARRKYFMLGKYPDDQSDMVPEHADSGFDITILLNEGDPDLWPPRKALLVCGSLNPKADTSYLPSWLFKYSTKRGYQGMTLNINTVELNYSEGMLHSTLECSIPLVA